MTRPRKQTVDWFPHSCTHGRTMFTLERKYGILGYGFWFKLLEILGNTEGHSIDAEDLATMNYLQAQTYTNEETCTEILNLLSALDAIDPKLWKEKIIWSDNFVSGLAALYRNRNKPIPVKPDNNHNKPGQPGKKRKITVEEEKEGKEGKEKDIAPPGPSDTAGALPPVLFFSCQFFDVDFDYRMKLAKEFPALNDALLKDEFSKMEDWIIDNKRKKKFKANGQIGNPRAFIKNWLKKVVVDGQQLFGGSDKPKGLAAVQRFMQKGEESG